MDAGMVVSWVAVGLSAGGLARYAMKAGGYGLTGDLLFGLLGSFVGGGIISTLPLTAGDGILAATFVAFIGAVVVIVSQRAFWPNPRLGT